MLRLFPLTALLLLIMPVLAGLAGILLPAFGYFPALGHHGFSFKPFSDLLAMPGLFRSACLSFGVGLATTAISLGTVALFMAGWRNTKQFRLLTRLVSPLLSVPHAAAAFGLAILLAPSGFMVRMLSPWATGWERPPDLLIVNDRLGLTMAVALIVKEIPFLFLMALAALPQSRAAEMERITASLGYGRIAGFIHGTLPALYRQIRLAVLAVLAYATSVVDVAMILGPTTPAPLSVRILDWRNDPDLDQQLVAAAGAVLQLGIVAAALLVWLIGERAAAFIARRLAVSGWRARSDGLLRKLGAALMALSAGIVLTGIVLLALWSVAGEWRFPQAIPESLSLSAWMRLAQSFSGPLWNSVAIACVATCLATVLALGALEHQARAGCTRTSRALSALYVPLLVPQIAFIFGLQILFAYVGIDGTFTAVLVVHLVFVFPYVLLSLSEPWWHWDPRYGYVMRALGRGEDAIFWRIRLPMLARPLLTAAAVGFAISIALYLPTLLIGAGRWPTVTTETLALASGGDRRLTGATALVQALLPFLGFAIAALIPAFLFRNRRLLRTGG